MSFYDSEISDKAAQWKIPLQPPRTLRGKLNIFKAIPGLAFVGIIFIPVGIAVGILFFSLGMFNDIIINDWETTLASPVKWVNSTGERINSTYIPGIEVQFETADEAVISTVVKVSNLNQVQVYKNKFNNKLPIKVEYSESRPHVARIAGMKSTAVPKFLILFPIIFVAVGFFIILLAGRLKNRMVYVLENGTFTTGKITKIHIMQRNRNSKYAKSTNKSVFLRFEFSADGDIIQAKAAVSEKIGSEFTEGMEIPVIYSVFGYKYKAYCPLFLNVEFD